MHKLAGGGISSKGRENCVATGFLLRISLSMFFLMFDFVLTLAINSYIIPRFLGCRPFLGHRSLSAFSEQLNFYRPKSQERKSSPKRKFLGRISRGHRGAIRADIPAQNFGQGGQNPGKTSISVRTSMTRRRGRPRPSGVSKNFGQKNFGLNFRSLIKE